MFYPKSKAFTKRPADMKKDFIERFKKALGPRMFPHTSLRVDDLAYAIGCHGMALRSWLRGESCASGYMVAAVVDYFVRRGDYHFLVEIYPGVEPLVAHKKEAEEALVFVRGLAKFAPKETAAA